MEDVIKKTGHRFGVHEVFTLLVLALVAIPTSFVIFLEIVTTEEPEVCVWDSSHEKCDIYDGAPENVCKIADRDMWQYNYPLMTVISTYDLLCQEHWEKCLPQLLFYLGMLPSCILAGYLSDQFGRKTALVIFLLMECIFLSLLIIVRNYIGFLVLRYFTGLSIGFFVNCETLIIEGLKVRYRSTFTAVIWCSFSVGTITLGLLGVVFDRYIDMVACIVVFSLILLIAYILCIDESLRWLLIKQKKSRAEYMLSKLAYQNNVEMPKYEDIPKPEDESYSIIDFFILPNIRMMTFILLQLSILSFYLLVDYTQITIDLIMSDQNYDKYGFQDSESARSVNFLLTGLISVLGVLMTAVLCAVMGRRSTVVLLLWASLIALVLVFSFPSKRPIIDIASYIIRLVAPGLVYLSSLYSLEVHITPLRARAVGLSVAGAALGGIISAVKAFRGDLSHEPNIYITAAEAAVVLYVLVLCIMLPETKDGALPDKIEDMPSTINLTHWCKCKDSEETTPLLKDKDTCEASSSQEAQ